MVSVCLRAGDVPIWCKLEFLNPSGSTKDRIARYILGKAWRRGEIARGSRVVEASSGSTSIAMAMVSAQLGLRFTAVMPEGVSHERSLSIRAYGGSVISSPAGDGLPGSVRVAERLSREEGAFFPRQFENPDNAAAHRFATAVEAIEQIPSAGVDAVVSGVGTGGTLVGLYRGFEDQGCRVRPFAARPVSKSPGGEPALRCFSEAECCSFSSCIPGVVENMSGIYRPEELEGLAELDVSDADAIDRTRELIRHGFPVGPSSGLNYAAAQTVANTIGADSTIVTVFPDRMERYFSTDVFGDLTRSAHEPPAAAR